MICCINAECQKPLNSDDATHCRSCGAPLVRALRNRYRPVKLLGQGGFGRTYLAQDQDRLNSKCVIKQFAPQVRSAHARAKAVSLFNQEAVRLHELGEHPQIPALLAYFEEDSYLYLVQQYIEGPSLAQELNRHGPLNESRLRQFLVDLLPVLQFVHRNQVIHRDITPMNILRRAIDGRVVLIDFGVAKQLNMQLPAQPGTRIGTEGYSPIEQFRGGRAYPASDLYSLGATCLHLLTNTRPDFLYDPLRGEWMWQESLREQQRPISAGLTAILNKMVQDMVSDRYQSALEVLTVLNDLQPVSSVSVSSAITIVDAPGTSQSPASTSAPPVSPPPQSPERAAPAPAPHPAGAGPRATPAAQLNPPAGSGASAFPPVTGGAQTPPPRPERSPQPGAKKTSPPQPPVGYRRSRPPSGPPRPPQVVRPDDAIPNQPPHSPAWRCECLYTISAHSSWVTGISLSPDSSLFATSGLDNQAKLWDFKTGRLHRVLLGHTRGVHAVSYSPTRGGV
ncbi:MAG: protein kinase [Leptolyngbyaceae cyanobacterium]